MGYLRAGIALCVLVLSSSTDEPVVPKPLKDGEKPTKAGWFGQRVYPKKPSNEIWMGAWRDGEERFWRPNNLMNCEVREDRDGFVRVFDGRQEGWVKKADLITVSDAVDHFDKAVKANADDLYARWMRGVSLLDSGEPKKAVADFDELIRRDPEDMAAYNSRGRAWRSVKEYEKAAADFTVVIRHDPKDPVVLNNRGNVYDEMKQHDKAIDDYTEALRLDPLSVITLSNRGNSWGKK